MRIGLFDSGIGGLTVLKSLIKRYPNNDYIYLGDTKNLPYGSKTKEELLKLAKSNIDFLISQKVDKIIVACGTVSSNCIDELISTYKIPIISIVNPTIEYLKNKKHHNIGVIATERTISSHIFKNSLNSRILEISTPKLVPLIEENNEEKIKVVLNEYLSDFKTKIDVLILGCTHYPIIENEIKEVIGKETQIINMADIIALENNNGNCERKIYFTKLNETIITNTKNLLGEDIKISSI